MRIINVMFGRNLGGIEQAFLDYCTALELAGHDVLNVAHSKAAIIPHIKGEFYHLRNFGQYDFFAILKLRKLIEKYQPDAIICHGNRAISLMSKAAKNICPVIGVAHNYNIKRLAKLDAAFTITKDLQDRVMARKVFHIPNMVNVPQSIMLPQEHETPIVIGAMGRFVKKKGFDVFIHSIKKVTETTGNIKVLIAGEGEEKESLRQLTDELNLSHLIEFTGWIDDKEDFFTKLDMFVLPSLHEPFGIVLLEALSYARPVITTDSEGPMEICTHHQDALIVRKNDEDAMAKAITELIGDYELRHTLATNGYNMVTQNYAIQAISQKIDHALHYIVRK